MNKKKFSVLIALMMCMVLAFSVQSSAEEFGWSTPDCTTNGGAAGVDINVGMGI